MKGRVGAGPGRGRAGGMPTLGTGSRAESRSSRLHAREWEGREAGVLVPAWSCISPPASASPEAPRPTSWSASGLFQPGVTSDDTVLFDSWNGICFRPLNAATSGVGGGEYLYGVRSRGKNNFVLKIKMVVWDYRGTGDFYFVRRPYFIFLLCKVRGQ